MKIVRIAALCAVLALPASALALGLPAPGAVSPQTLKLPSGPGSVRGLADDPAVSVFSGQLSYAVPLELPAVARGFSPSLSLEYAGELGNGVLGVGFRFSLPELRRSLRLGVPRYDASDELELAAGGGGRLVEAGDGSYRLEGQGHFVKVEPRGQGFVAHDGQGTRYELGTSSASRVEDGGRVQAWLAERIVDAFGQTIELSYERDQGQLYLTELRWGPRLSRRATLVYETRSDAAVSHRRGFRVVTARRLREVRATVDGALHSVYRLSYDQTFSLSRLASVQRFGTDGTTALPATRFEYASPAPAAVQTLSGAEGWLLGEQGVSIADVDADGIGDLLRMWNGQHAFRRNLGGSFAAVQALRPGAAQFETLDHARLMDLDGDARAELVTGDGSSDWSSYRLVGDRWVGPVRFAGSAGLPLQPGPADSAGAVHLDVDGDGRTDVLSATTSGMLFYRNVGSGFAPAVTVPDIAPGVYPGASRVRFLDLNGDGLDDALRLDTRGMDRYLGRGDGRFEAAGRTSFPWPEAGFAPRDLQLADLDRDGLVDVVRITVGDVEWYQGLADGSLRNEPRYVARPAGTDAEVRVTVADVNGNGSDELVWCSLTEMYALDLSGATTAGMLVAVDNGLGKTQRYEYEATGKLALADELAGRRWSYRLPTSLPVPVRVRTELGSGEPARELRYAVRDGVWDGSERRFAGFLEGATYEGTGSDQRSDEQRFHPGLGLERALRGKTLWSRVRAGGALHAITHFTWAARPVAGLPDGPLTRKAVLLEERSFAYEGVTQPLETRTTFRYDAEGRQIEERRLGRIDLSGDEVNQQWTYASDDARWIRDRVCEHKTLRADDRVVAHERTYFGDASRVLALCEVGLGLEREVQAWLAYADETPRFVTTRSARYDALGQPVELVNGSVRRTLTYDADGLHPVSETIQPSATQTLRWTMSWDPVLGLPVSSSQPGGGRSTFGHDALGRLVSIAEDDQLPHTHYVYDFRAPTPSTRSFVYDGPAGAVPALGQGARFREQVTTYNGAGEALVTATRLASNRWLTEQMVVRDARGRVVETLSPFEATGSEPPRAAPSSVPRVRVAFDALSRAVRKDLPDGRSYGVLRRAFARELSFPGLATEHSRFDGLGRMVHTERTVSGRLESVDARYDEANRLTSSSVANGRAVSTFAYDSLGRLRESLHPDIGLRRFSYADGGELLSAENGEGQLVRYTHDAAGRVVEVDAGGGRRYAYHYDAASDPRQTYTAGRVARIEEPSGELLFSYDAQGRPAWTRRTVAGSALEWTSEQSPSGLLLSERFDDGFEVRHEHDAAGRLVQVGPYWRAVRMDAAGRSLEDEFGNGLRQSFERDVMGRLTAVQLERSATPALLYAVGIQRTDFGSISRVLDEDGAGLDHAAEFDFDAGGRLTRAQLGGVTPFTFTYDYDELSNLTLRTASGPHGLEVSAGRYGYGGGGHGPRQLTQITPSLGAPLVRRYDAAGRLLESGDQHFHYDAFDRLLSVEQAGDEVEYDYGYDLRRTYTRSVAGEQERWYRDDVMERDGVRTYYVRAGEQLVAKVVRRAVVAAAPAPATATARVVTASAGQGPLLGALLMLSLLLVRRRRFALPGLLALLATSACSAANEQTTSVLGQALAVDEVTYFHVGIGAGPVLATDARGLVVDERRYEPFGVPIDAYAETAPGQGSLGEIDHAREPHNALNKPTDPDTGFSYHGARWLSPQTAQWLTPDPPLKSPDTSYMERPWDLHPYQYVSQNPVAFWDPDGNDGALSDVTIKAPVRKYSTDYYSRGPFQAGHADLETGTLNGTGHYVEAKAAALQVSDSFTVVRSPGDNRVPLMRHGLTVQLLPGSLSLENGKPVGQIAPFSVAVQSSMFGATATAKWTPGAANFGKPDPKPNALPSFSVDVSQVGATVSTVAQDRKLLQGAANIQAACSASAADCAALATKVAPTVGANLVEDGKYAIEQAHAFAKTFSVISHTAKPISDGIRSLFGR